jgi:hypothetical protein
MTSLAQAFRSAPFRLQVTVVGLALLAFLWALAWYVLPSNQNSELPFSFLIVCVGVGIGGLIGALVSPGPSEEKETFKTVAGLISAFLTGALWATFSDKIKIFFEVTVWGSPVSVGRLFLFVLSMILGAFVMYVFRAYGKSPEQKELQENIKKIRELLGSLERSAGPR